MKALQRPQNPDRVQLQELRSKSGLSEWEQLMVAQMLRSGVRDKRDRACLKAMVDRHLQPLEPTKKPRSCQG